MAQAARPSSAQILDRQPSAAHSMGPPNNQGNSSPAGLGGLELVELQTNPLIEGILGPNKDGRIRTAVPSKLKGKTDNKQGNFGVMHMGLNHGSKKVEGGSRDVAAERDAAARKTSENTESRAKAAQQQKYAPPKKRGFEATLNEATRNTTRGSPFQKDDRRQQRPLAPDETKMEQARLLTLLRSINPITVVDQICKAVAYFGGIPGAPPPEDGIFPESANTRETGALFIGWLAEIFPDVTARSPEVPKVESKKKNRPSKGFKADLATEAPNSSNGYGYGPAVSGPSWGLANSLAEANPQAPSVPESAIGAAIEQPRQIEQQPSTPLKQQDSANDATSASKRKRGRPKGSTNKNKKGDGQAGDEVIGSNNNNIGFEGQNHSAGAQVAESSAVPTYPGTQGQPSFQSTDPKPVQDLQYANQTWQNDSHKHQTTQAPIMPPDELSPEERAVLEAFRNPGLDSVAVANTLSSPVVSATNQTDKPQPAKRKRAPPKPKPKPAETNTTTSSINTAVAPSTTSTGNYNIQNAQQIVQQNPTQAQQTSHQVSQIPDSNPLSAFGNDATMSLGKDGMQWRSVDNSTPTAPPAKRPRQRKPKAQTANETASRNQTTSTVNSATPPIPPSTIPDSTAGSSQQSLQQSIPTNRQPAEGLEAHYERFAPLQQPQSNGRSHTPTQSHQQHVRQPSKPSSVTSQQTTPQMSQQMQHQKSQSGTQQPVQRDEQSMNQAVSSRSTTGYYNQQRNNSTSYSQQYPSHQPSQLYSGHAVSPQMSNSSYRTSSSHTMAQASPQFSSTENSYRTASPHTISQPSPSFPQSDNQFRATNNNALTQPSQPYSQPESAYRAPSAHSMPSQSYSTSTSTSRAHQPTNQYSQFSDSSYIDLPNLDSIGQTGGYGQAGIGLSNRSSGSTNSLYGTSSGLGHSYDVTGGANDLLRVSRGSASTNHGPYNSSGAYDPGSATEHDLREKLLRNIGRR